VKETGLAYTPLGSTEFRYEDFRAPTFLAHLGARLSQTVPAFRKGNNKTWCACNIVFRFVRATVVAVGKSIGITNFELLFCSLRYPACNAAVQYFPALRHKYHDFRKRVIEHKMCFLSQYLTNLMRKICFTISFISCLYMFRAHVLETCRGMK